MVKNKPSKNEIHPHLFLDEMRNERFSKPSYIKKPKSKKKSVLQTEGTFPTSHSDLSIYNRCPYDYKLRSVMGFVVGIPAAFGYGLNIHNILNLIHSNYIQHQKIPTTEEIEKTFDDMFYLRFAPGIQNETMKNAGSKVVKSYVELHKEDFKRILETEKRFEFVMGKSLIAGDIDLLKKVNDKGEITEIEIIDFKTDKQKDDGKYEQDHSEQVRFYAYATRMSLGYKPEKALIHHLDTHEKDYVDISDVKLEETKARIEQNVDKIVSRDFDASPEKIKCEGCDFRALCPHKEFEVGVNFKPAKSAKNSGSMRKDDDIDEELESIKRDPLKPSVVSASIMKKAEKIAKGPIKQINDGSFQIPSGSDPDKSYTVTESSCQCKGYGHYSGRNPGTIPTCSHIEGIKIFKKLNSKSQ